MTPDAQNLQPHPGFIWVKSGYSEPIAWRKVRLMKQRNVDLTTDGLWAMPLNTGCVPVKARRLQDWQKLKQYVPIHKHGNVCPNGVPALVEGNYKFGQLRFGIISGPLCTAPSCVSTSFQPFAQKYGHLPPPLTYTFLKRPFLTDFKKYTHTPPKGTIFWRIRRKSQKLREKCQNPPGWHTMNVPERYVHTCGTHSAVTQTRTHGPCTHAYHTAQQMSAQVPAVAGRGQEWCQLGGCLKTFWQVFAGNTCQHQRWPQATAVTRGSGSHQPQAAAAQPQAAAATNGDGPSRNRTAQQTTCTGVQGCAAGTGDTRHIRAEASYSDHTYCSGGSYPIAWSLRMHNRPCLHGSQEDRRKREHHQTERSSQPVGATSTKRSQDGCTIDAARG